MPISPENKKLCDLCSVDTLGDEYHILFECKTLMQYSNCHLPHYYRSRPSMFMCVVTFSHLENGALAIKLGAFLKKACIYLS